MVDGLSSITIRESACEHALFMMTRLNFVLRDQKIANRVPRARRSGLAGKSSRNAAIAS
jgi:hypothetical protein